MKKAPWTTIKLEEVAGDVGIFVDGDWVESKDQDPKGNTRLTQLADIGVGEFLDRSSRFLTSEKAKELKCTFLKEGDILVARMPDPIGRACIFPGDKHPCVTVVDVCIIRPNPREICNRWLMWMINSPQFKRQLDQYISGTTRQRISRKNLQKLEIPLPPLEEQRRIAAILDKADEVRRKRKEAIRLTEELLKSTFLDLFGDPVTNPKGWEICEIGKITNVKTGKTPSREDEENYGGDVRWVKTTEVRELIIEETEEFLTEKGASQVTIFPQNTILIAMYGQGATRGRTALLGLPCATNQACAAIIPSKKYAPFYLWTLLRLSYERLRELGRGGNQPNLNLSMVKEFLIPMPPLEKQIYFQNIALNLQSQCEKMDRNLQYQNNLFNSLLQRAFRGEL
jgi:type I restriction enzyme, S subunit